MNVITIKKQECYPWLLEKHYAKRIPSIMYSFGLYDEMTLLGVITYGMPPCAGLQTSLGMEVLELNRLCILDDAPRNSASILVGRSLQMLGKGSVVISYADTNQSHVGYIYQATNWMYTGTGGQKKEYRLHGKTIHDRSLGHKGLTKTCDRDNYILDKGGEIIEKQPKHRYLFVVGKQRLKKKVIEMLGWKSMDYPKGESRRYDAGGEVSTQGLLFS